MAQLLFLAGSAQRVQEQKASRRYGPDAGAQVTHIDLKDFDMPLYDGDVEGQCGILENATKLKQLFVEDDGFFIVSPEYNSSIPPLLKNTVDRVSRPHEKMKRL